MEAPDWFPSYGATAFAALVGSLARGRAWRGADGRLVVARFLTEGATAVGLSMAVVAAGEYFHVDLKLLIGVAVFAGWLGPAAVSDMVLSRLPGKKL